MREADLILSSLRLPCLFMALLEQPFRMCEALAPLNNSLNKQPLLKLGPTMRQYAIAVGREGQFPPAWPLLDSAMLLNQISYLFKDDNFYLPRAAKQILRYIDLHQTVSDKVLHRQLQVARHILCAWMSRQQGYGWGKGKLGAARFRKEKAQLLFFTNQGWKIAVYLNAAALERLDTYISYIRNLSHEAKFIASAREHVQIDSRAQEPR